MKIYKKKTCNVDTATLSNCSIATITGLNLSLFFSKSTTNYLHSGTKIVVTYIVNTYNRARWKNRFFICFTMWSTEIAVTFVQWVYKLMIVLRPVSGFDPFWEWVKNCWPISGSWNGLAHFELQKMWWFTENFFITVIHIAYYTNQYSF
jgi:hypothetical protein